jgi:hypothetical protein
MVTVKVPSEAVTGSPADAHPCGSIRTPGTGCQTPSDHSACTVPEKAYGSVTTTCEGDGSMTNRTFAWTDLMVTHGLHVSEYRSSPAKCARTAYVPCGKDIVSEKEPSGAVDAEPTGLDGARA